MKTIINSSVQQVNGLDISHFQCGEAEKLSPKGNNLTFVICKATEGISWIDPCFTKNWDAITKAGFVRGAYHFYACADNPLDQVTHFLDTVGKGIFTTSDLPPIVDFEELSIPSGYPDPASIERNLLIFLQSLKEQTGRTPMLYTDDSIGDQYLTDPAFLEYPLYIASYRQQPNLPNLWKKSGKWALWQKSDDYKLDHFTNDYDVFNGDSATFEAFLKA